MDEEWGLDWDREWRWGWKQERAAVGKREEEGIGKTTGLRTGISVRNKNPRAMETTRN